MKKMLVSLFLFLGFGFFSGLFAEKPGKYSDRLMSVVENRSEAKPVAAWVFFRDKGRQLSKKLKETAANLTEKAYHRRLRERGFDKLVDFQDVPVSSAYVQDILPHIIKLRHKSRWLNAISVEVLPKKLAHISQLHFVERVDWVVQGRAPLPDVSPVPPAFQKTTTDNGATMLDYGLSFDQNNQINTIPMHDAGYSGSGVLIASLDSGFPNLNHEALQHLDIVATRDFINGDDNVGNEPGQLGNHGHGTNTLGTIAGFKEGQLVGPAYGASYLLAKTEVAEYERHIEEDNWMAAAEWADSLGADIITSSLGYFDFDPGEGDYTANDMDGQTTIVTIAAETAASRGILVVVSAGNSGPSPRSIGAPADGPNVLTSGGVNNTGSISTFSSRGPTADGRTKPDVVARASSTRTVSSGNPSNYVSINGTSFSCPLVAGAAALIMEANPAITSAEVRDFFRNTASNAFGNGGTPDNDIGWGIIDTEAANLVALGGGELPPTGPDLRIETAFPNPFRNQVTIRYNLPADGHLYIAVYNVRGQRLATLQDRQESAGSRSLSWEPGNIAQGIYFILISANGEHAGRKVVRLR